MDIPINAEVRCADGPAGRSTCVLINPVSDNVTHIVVQEKGFLGLERMVPLELITESTPQVIHLRCTRQELAKFNSFLESAFIRDDVSPFVYELGEFRLWPFVEPEDGMVSLDIEQLPPGELGIHRGAHVNATDGRIGQVNEFLVDPSSGHITHLVLREGHLWGKRDVTVPVSAIDRIEDDEVYLKLDKPGIEQLPAIPVRSKGR